MTDKVSETLGFIVGAVAFLAQELVWFALLRNISEGWREDSKGALT